MSEITNFTRDCLLVRKQSPLVHNITNYVAMSLSANALLAIGASPLMSAEPLEMEQIVAVSSSLVINIGCLESVSIKAMELAASCASRLGRPWVLDPVGAGASSLRTDTALGLVERHHPCVIRANASEVLALAGISAVSHGVDSAADSRDALDAARQLAKRWGTVVSMSGEVDYITDGTSVISIANGSPMLPRVTAMGCTASALTGAFVAVDGDVLQAAASAMALAGVAGEMAAARSRGTGSLQVEYLDILSTFNPEEIEKQIRYEQSRP